MKYVIAGEVCCMHASKKTVFNLPEVHTTSIAIADFFPNRVIPYSLYTLQLLITKLPCHWMGSLHGRLSWLGLNESAKLHFFAGHLSSKPYEAKSAVFVIA